MKAMLVDEAKKLVWSDLFFLLYTCVIVYLFCVGFVIEL